MNVIDSKKIIALIALVFTISAVPATAVAGPSLHLDLPGLSIGLNDRYYDRRNHRYKYYPKPHQYKKRYYYDKYYKYNPYYSNRYYRDNYSYDDYRSYRSRDRRSSDYCPTPGYSDRYYRNSGCYDHGDHYHCDR